jgi:hypothetical protein
MEYGIKFGNESLEIEFKEFTFNHGGLEIDSEKAEELVQSSYWCFNNMILESIKKYLKVYIPKYSSAFLNEESLINEGEFYIGISDDGIVQGIPFQGSMNINILKEELNKIINNFIKSDDNDILNNSICLELLEVTYSDRKIDKYNNLYNEFLLLKEKNFTKRQDYKKKLNTWLDIHNKYTQRLVDLFNKPIMRHELLNYIKLEDPTNNVINMILNGHILESCNHEEINERKNYLMDPYYWICKFKDEHIDKLRKLRPVLIFNKQDFTSFINPISIIMKTSNMIPWWIQNNENMNLYVIKIKFIKNEFNKNISYVDNFGNLNKCYRSLKNGNPYCQPI